MVRSRKLDDKEIQLKNQSRAFFQISGAGHEAVLVAAGLTLKPGYDWFHPYYRDRALCLQLGVTPLEMLLASVGAAADPSNGGRQMPSHWGHKALNIVSGSSATAHAGAARGRRGGSGRHLQPRRGDRRSRIAIPAATRSSTPRSARARPARASSGKSLNTACTRRLPVLYPRRRQRLRDFGAGRSRRRRAATSRGCVRSFPGLHVDVGRRHRFLRQPARACARPPPTCARARAPRSCTRASSGRTRTRCPTTRSCTRRRRSAKPKRGAIRSRGSRSSCATTAWRPPPSSQSISGRSRSARSTKPRSKRLRAPEPPRSTAADCASIRRTWIQPPTAFEHRQRSPRASPTRWSAAINRTLKDEMARDPRIVVFGEDVADASRREALKVVPGKGGVFKVTHGLQRAVRRRSRVQRADCRSQHHRPRRSAWRCAG